MSKFLTYIRRIVRKCLICVGYAYCVHSPDTLDEMRGNERPSGGSGRVTRRENFKTVA